MLQKASIRGQTKCHEEWKVPTKQLAECDISFLDTLAMLGSDCLFLSLLLFKYSFVCIDE